MENKALLDAINALRQSTLAPTVDNYAESLEKSSPEEERLSIVSFYLGEAEFAFELPDAVEVLRLKPLTEVPRTPDFINGILSVRGEMVPVMDLKKRLSIGQLEQERLSARILVVSVEELKVGFLVDRMGGVKEVPASSLEGSSEGFVKGVISHKGASIRLLDAPGLIDFSRISSEG